MGSSADLLRLHRDAILNLLATRGIEQVRVFGSIARGDDEQASDIDLIVELDGERSSGAELLEALELSELLTRLVGVRVDVVTPRSLRPEVRALAVAEAVPFVSRGEELRLRGVTEAIETIRDHIAAGEFDRKTSDAVLKQPRCYR